MWHYITHDIEVVSGEISQPGVTHFKNLIHPFDTIKCQAVARIHLLSIHTGIESVSNPSIQNMTSSEQSLEI